MNSNVVSINDESTLEDTARLLASHRISGLPVIDSSGRLIGLVTEYDVIAKQGQTVADVMSRGVISVSPETDVEEVAHLLTSQRIRRVPVVEGDQLVGIVSRSDLVQQIAMRWVCGTCGEGVSGAHAPEQCPRCGASQDAFTRDIEHPRD
jgi:CBS domain-containing protein